MAMSKIKSESGVPVGTTFDEFMDWLDEDIRAEWIQQEIVMMSPGSRKHQEIVGFLSSILGTYVDEKELGEMLLGPFVMKLDQSARQPDILFVSKENDENIRNTYMDGAADLVVEVVSPESKGRDKYDKLNEYKMNGVKEYWIIDPLKNEEVFYVKDDGEYLEEKITKGKYKSSVLEGFELPVKWLWQDTLPKTLDAAKKLGLVG